MKITCAEFFHLDIPLIKPFQTSFGKIDKRPFIIVAITDDAGRVGYGECSALYVPISEAEVVTTCLTAYQSFFPQLIGKEFTTPEDIQTLLEPLRDTSLSYTGVEGSLLDLLAQSQKVSLSHVWSSQRSQISIGESIGIFSDFDLMHHEIEKCIAHGYRRIKFKIKPGHDIAVVEYVRLHFPNLVFGLDANAAYTSEDIDHLTSFGPQNISFIEQPFAANDLASHTALYTKLGVPICLDESITDLETAQEAVAHGACQMVNIKPARVGGYLKSKELHDYFFSLGIPLFGGGRLESGVGRIHNAHLFSLPGFTEASDMSPTLDYFTYDITNPPFTNEAGTYTIPTGIGAGITINQNIISKFLVTHKKYETA